MGWTVRAVALLACCLVACIQAELVPCGDKLCAAGSTCVAGELCASADQLAACNGLADGTSCSATGGVGRCDRGVCTPSGCGNNVVELGEVCDDGNQTSGDGCRGDCQKIEVCGDGVVDAGEQCDDANDNPSDRCDACSQTTWVASATIGANAAGVGIGLPQGVAFDRDGNLYVADFTANRVLRIDSAGTVTTVAGTGGFGYTGDGGPATSARLLSPAGLAIDGLGDVFIADSQNHCIRKVDPNGIITTVAGTGVSGFSGDGGVATGAKLNHPFGVAVDGLGNIYIADTSNHRIRMVDPTGIITTIAGTGVGGFGGDGAAATGAQLFQPSGIAIDATGTLYIGDTINNRIRQIASTGIITTIAGTGASGYSGDHGPATSATMHFPSGIAFDAGGAVLVADTNNSAVRRIAGGTITTIAGTGVQGFGGDGGLATAAQVNDPFGVAVDGSGSIYIADSSNGRVRHIDAAGLITTVTVGMVSDGDGGAATAATLHDPSGTAFDAAGNVYFTDALRIRRIDPLGVVTTIAGTGTSGNGGDGGPAMAAQFATLGGVAIDGNGNIYVADTFNNRVRKIDPGGTITAFAGTGTGGLSGDNGAATNAKLDEPWDVAVDDLGNVFIADTLNSRIRRVDHVTGTITTFAGTNSGFGGDGGAATAAHLGSPYGVSVDATRNIYIADTGNDRVRRVDHATGIITTVAGNGVSGAAGDSGAATSAQLSAPFDAAADAAGNVYIADRDNNRIRRVDHATGIITTFAGSVLGIGGDGGPAGPALFDQPVSIAIDPSANLYIADHLTNWIRKIDPSGIITSIAGSCDPRGTGPLGQARLADPRALVVAAPFTVFAGGSSGTVELAVNATSWLEVGAGRYPNAAAVGTRARYRGQSFGTVAGVAYDAAGGRIFLTESNRIHAVTLVDPTDPTTWTIAAVGNTANTAGFANGPLATAQFRAPTGLYLDDAAHVLYVADTGNFVVRAIDLSAGIASATVTTIAGTPETRGFFGDGGAATAALLYRPEAMTRCPNGDLMIADTGNHRVRRVAAQGATISTVLGVGVAASSGEGDDAVTFPVNAPRGVACDAIGNVFVTSTSAVRLLPADANGVVDGHGPVETIYGGPQCLTGIAVVDGTHVQLTDSCTGLLVELHRQ